MAKILVTGGAGFIGSNLVDRLIADGHDVVIIDNLVSGKKEYLNPQAKFYHLDIASEKISEIFAIQKFDFVCHLAAQIDVRRSVSDPEEDIKVNVLGGLNILKNCRDYGVKKLVFSSTGGAIYGEDAEIPTPETAAAEPISPYGIHKLTFEKYLNYYYRVYGQAYTVLRFANVYGPRQFKGGEAGVIAIFTDNGVDGRESVINGDGLQTRDFVYVGDVVEALVRALNSDYIGAINIGTGVEKSLLDVVLAIELALGHSIAKSHVPAKLGEQRRSCLSYERARQILGWEPSVDMNEGIKRTIAWAKSQKE
jgi:UDP-glucose 4-epimerase